MFNLSDRESFICRMVKAPVIVTLILMFFMSGTVLALSVGRDDMPLSIFKDGACRMESTVLDDAQEIMTFFKIELDEDEKYELHQMSEGLALLVGKPFTVKVQKGENGYMGTFPCCSVKTVFELLGVTLNENDRVDVALDTVLNDNATITVTSVEHKTETVNEEIPFETEYTDTDDLYEGETEVLTEGVCGAAEVTYNVVHHDGDEISRTAVSTSVITEPVTEVIRRGTGKKSEESSTSQTVKTSAAVTTSGSGITTSTEVNSRLVSPLSAAGQIEVDASGRPVNYKSCISATATAYSPEDGNWTATGEPAQLGLIAVNPRQIPYGTMMYIRTSDGSYIYGVAKAADTGGFISDSTVKVDLFFGSDGEAIQFGRRTVEIYFI